MSEAVLQNEFDWVPAVTDRTKVNQEKAKRIVYWCEATKEKGPIVPTRFVATLLGVSRQRVHQLVKLGMLESVEISGYKWITERSIEVYGKSEREAGRPIKGVKKADLLKSCYESVTEALNK